MSKRSHGKLKRIAFREQRTMIVALDRAVDAYDKAGRLAEAQKEEGK